ncbi:HK97 family phage prohead protease [Desulfococcaceae bacterium HSG8]|nr:HK97 family phage prohead protease [Desulfococcaceae bacterium HSG8]
MAEKVFTREIATWKPRTFDDASRSVRVVAVTENPVRTWDWERKDFVDEILLIEGANVPFSGQIPLLDSHNRSSVAGVLGSARNFEPRGSDTLECDVFFSGTEAGNDAAQKVKEGHLTDFSVGYFPAESYWIPSGQAHDVNGRTFRGPVKLTTKWNLMELSVTPIGADQMAKARSVEIVSSPQPPAQIQPSPAPAPPPAPEVPQAPKPVQPPPPQTPSQPPPAQVQQASTPPPATPESPPPPKPEARQAPQPDAAPIPPTKPIPPRSPEPETNKRSADNSIFSFRTKLKMDIVDMIFYAFTIFMIIFLLKGLLG